MRSFRKSTPILIAVTLVTAALRCTASPGPAGPAHGAKLSAEVVRYCQALYIGPPTRPASTHDVRVKALRMAAMAHFRGRPQEDVRSELEPYLKVLRPGTFAFSAVAYTLAYYIHPYHYTAPGTYGRWYSYLRWVTTLEADFPPPNAETFPNLIARPVDDGQMVSRALVRLYRMRPLGVVTAAFFDRDVSVRGAIPFQKYTIYLILQDPTSLAYGWNTGMRGRTVIIEALRNPQIPRSLRNRALAQIRLVAHDRQRLVALAARDLLKRVRTGRTGGV